MKYPSRRNILKGSIAMSAAFSFDGKSQAQETDENPFPPKTITMAEPANYSPLTYLNNYADGLEQKLSFSAASVEEAESWREELRSKLWELLGENHTPGESLPDAELVSSESLDTYTREKWDIHVVEGRSMPVWVLRPKNVNSPKTVLCLHGHGNGATDIIGKPANEEEAELIETLNTDYAYQAVQRGWCAVAPDLFAFGERLDYVEDARAGFDGGCEKPFLNAVQVGKTLIGIRAKDIMTCIDWMKSRDDMDTENLACIGLSGGGMMTMYVSALDSRIKQSIIAGYMTEAEDSILAIRHCSCNYVPRLHEWADFPDIGCAIAPRKLIIQTGRRDAIFPLGSVERAYETIEKAYGLYNSSDKLMLHVHNGFHSFWSPSLDELFV